MAHFKIRTYVPFEFMFRPNLCSIRIQLALIGKNSLKKIMNEKLYVY